MITHDQVQDLVNRLPDNLLPRAYRLLQDLASEKGAASSAATFLRLPIEERTRLLAEQADEMREYYESSAEERQEWQSGDFRDEH